MGQETSNHQGEQEFNCDPDGIPYDIVAEDSTDEVPPETHDKLDGSNNPPWSYDEKLDQTKLSDMKAKTWPRVKRQFASTPILAVYEKIRKTGLPNFVGAKILIKTKLNIPLWEKSATGHPDDQIVINGIKYGFSMNYLGGKLKEKDRECHPSAERYDKHVREYLTTEIEEGAILGPLDEPPFDEWTNTSPIMTRKKQGDPKIKKEKRRVIIDYSFPEGENVNAFVVKNNYNGRYIVHHLPMIPDIIDIIQEYGYNVSLASLDISRAYRNFPGCPHDLPLNGIKYKKRYYLDLAMPFGARTSSCYMQKVSEFICRALARMGLHAKIYLDDLLAFFPPQADEERDFRTIIKFVQDLGLPIAEHKLQLPGPIIKYLGIWIDIEKRQITLPEEKIANFKTLANWIISQKTITKKCLQRVIGKVNHISACVAPARAFSNRLLDDLRDHHGEKYFALSPQAIKDLQWFTKFLAKYNGRSIMKPGTPEWVIEADACPSGGGATDFSFYTSYPFPQKISSTYHISILECLNCLVSLRIFVTKERHHTTLELRCDNMPTIMVLSRGGAKDPHLAAIVRAVWLVVAKADIKIIYKHVPGVNMEIPDTFSRAYLEDKYKEKTDNLVKELALNRKVVRNYHFDFHNLI